MFRTSVTSKHDVPDDLTRHRGHREHTLYFDRCSNVPEHWNIGQKRDYVPMSGTLEHYKNMCFTMFVQFRDTDVPMFRTSEHRFKNKTMFRCSDVRNMMFGTSEHYPCSDVRNIGHIGNMGNVPMFGTSEHCLFYGRYFGFGIFRRLKNDLNFGFFENDSTYMDLSASSSSSPSPIIGIL